MTINEENRNIQSEAAQENESILSTPNKILKPSTNKKHSKEFASPPKKKPLKRKNEERTRVDEAYSIMKNLQNNCQQRDRFTVFGEHVGNKMRLLQTETARNTVEHIISNTLWEASLGKYDHQPPEFAQHNDYSSTLSTPTFIPVPLVSPTVASIASTSSIASASNESNYEEEHAEYTESTGGTSGIIYEALRDVMR